MVEENTTFPAYFTAVTVDLESTLEQVLDAMKYDVAAILHEGDIVGTVTSTRITHALRTGDARPSDGIQVVMEPYQALGDQPDSMEDRLRDVFYIFLFSLIQRQVERKVFDPNNRDGFINTVFNHVRRQLNAGKYESCRQRMTFSHWVRTVSNNKVIDELRKLPAAETVETFRDRQRVLGHLSNPNPVRTANQSDVMQIIHASIEQLPEKQRIALLQSMKTPDLPGVEVAEKLGMTLNAFHLNLNRARDKIQKLLTEYAPETVHTVKNLRNKPRKND